jgi:hypothetical protein
MVGRLGSMATAIATGIAMVTATTDAVIADIRIRR